MFWNHAADYTSVTLKQSNVESRGRFYQRKKQQRYSFFNHAADSTSVKHSKDILFLITRQILPAYTLKSIANSLM